MLRQKYQPSNPEQDANVARVVKEIEKSVMKKMKGLEAEAVAAGANSIKVGGDRAKTMVTGLGGRHQRYSKAIARVNGDK